MKFYIFAAATACVASPVNAQITATANGNATSLASALQGSGVTFTSANLATNTTDAAGGNGTFTGGLTGTGIDQGVVLTNGRLGCVTSTNTTGGCSGSGNFSTLTLGFTATNAELFFNYVFASEEYNDFVGASFNDAFSLTLAGANYTSGVNLARLADGTAVSVNNVNNTTNSAFFRSNSAPNSQNLPISFDGLTTVLTASAFNLVVGTDYTLTFDIRDVADSAYDSAVFIQSGSIGTVTPPVAVVPEPATWAMMLVGFGMIGATARYRRRSMTTTYA